MTLLLMYPVTTGSPSLLAQRFVPPNNVAVAHAFPMQDTKTQQIMSRILIPGIQGCVSASSSTRMNTFLVGHSNLTQAQLGGSGVRKNVEVSVNDVSSVIKIGRSRVVHDLSVPVNFGSRKPHLGASPDVAVANIHVSSRRVGNNEHGIS